jgi:hypothetical protein
MVPSISVRGVLVALALANGCAPPRPVESDDAMSQVRGVIARYDSAWLAKDSVAVASWLATDYVYFTSSGGRSDRASTLRFLSDTGYSLRGQQRTELGRAVTAASWSTTTRPAFNIGGTPWGAGRCSLSSASTGLVHHPEPYCSAWRAGQATSARAACIDRRDRPVSVLHERATTRDGWSRSGNSAAALI